MGNRITKRISEFRGINRSLRPGAIDLSYAYDAVNVDIVGGMLTNKNVGSSRIINSFDSPIIARPIIALSLHRTFGECVILRNKYKTLIWAYNRSTGEVSGGFDPAAGTGSDVVNDTSLYINGCCENPLQTNIGNMPCVIVPQLLGESSSPSNYRGRAASDTLAKTGVYYVGDDAFDSLHCRQFGSGLYMFKDNAVTGKTDTDGVLTSITITKTYASLTDAEKSRLTLDGIYLFSSEIGNNVDEDDINNAYMWLEVTSVESGTGGKAKLNVKTTRLATDVLSPSYAYLRGGCSDMPISHCCMFYNRLFASGVEKNNRLYWSCLPGDGRSIEDWTYSDASIDTSGGHVDLPQPIETIIVCGSQLLIFTTSQLWRLYGSTPSTYRLERVCELEHARISNPVESNGRVFWLTIAGVEYYNGSYVSVSDDNDNTRNFLSSFSTAFVDALDPTAVEARMMDGSIMFAFNIADNTTEAYEFAPVAHRCMVLRYNTETGNFTRYLVPLEAYNQQFTDVLTTNFGIPSTEVVQYETWYLQAICSKTALTFTKWRDWGRQDFGWYDSQAVKSLWQSGWTDMQTPEAVKKIQTICLRGSGEFTLTIESEHNKESIEVKMPDNEYAVKEITPRYAEGRSFRITIESERPFSIEPNMTLLFEYGGMR